MTELTIKRLTATVHEQPHVTDARGRVDRMLHRLAERGLQDALSQRSLPAGEWCVRRVDLVLPFGSDDHDATVESTWADAVIGSLEQLLLAPPGQVVHYRRRSAAVTDLVASIAAGRLESRWAWRQLGILSATDPDPASDPAGALLSALGRVPDQALHAVLAVTGAGRLAVLHQCLGAGGWLRLAAMVAGATGVPVADLRRLLSADAAAPGGERAGAPFDSGQHDVADRADRVVIESTFAAALIRSTLRPAPAVTAAWAVLAVAEADPAALLGAAADDLIGLVARTLRRGAGAGAPSLVRMAGPAAPGRARSRTATHRLESEAPVLALPPKDDTGALPAAPVDRSETSSGNEDVFRDAAAPAQIDQQDADTDAVTPGDDDAQESGALTVWAGLLFLLSTAEAAGVSGYLTDDSRLGSRSVRWVMHQLALRLVPIAADDPAALAFAGLQPGIDPPSGVPTGAAEESALAECAARWTLVTAQRLAHPAGTTDPVDVVLNIGRRRGEIIADRGWIEVHLDLADVDVNVRRAGLDLDPGWVPWLGVVVRFVYD